jgi:hypothetical protein
LKPVQTPFDRTGAVKSHFPPIPPNAFKWHLIRVQMPFEWETPSKIPPKRCKFIGGGRVSEYHSHVIHAGFCTGGCDGMLEVCDKLGMVELAGVAVVREAIHVLKRRLH